MTLVLTADNIEKANALFEINFDNLFDKNNSIIINDDSKKLANLLPFIFTIENWQQSNLNIFDIHPIEDITYNIDEYKQGIVMTDAQCKDYQKLTPNEILDMFKSTKYEQQLAIWFEYLNSWYDIQENEASSFLLVAAINNMQSHIYDICRKYKVENTNIKERSKIFKYIHTNIRLTSCNPLGGYYKHDEYLHMQYLQDLLNRRVYINVEDKKELYADLELRIQPPPGFRWLYLNNENEICGDSSKFLIKLQNNLNNMFDAIVNDINVNELIPFDDFWATRANSMPSGAATGYKYKDQPLDKRAAHELGLILKEDVLNENSIVYASASMKYENGKCRFLYSTDVHDQTRTDYLLNVIDKHLHVLPAAGMGLNQTQELRQEILLGQSARIREECVSFDYEDYNNQHTYDYMMAFWIALANSLQTKFGHAAKDYLHIIDIKIKTMQNRFIGKLGNDGMVFKSIHTLLSGSRETATLNGTNNIAYSKTIEDNLRELTDEDTFKFLKCVGDDQTGSTKSQKHAILLILFMLCAGCEGNTRKILLGIEFLRKMYWPDQNICGYLNRSICNLVSRDQNRTERVDKHTIPTSLITQLRKIKSRGGDVDALDIIFNWTIKNKCLFTKNNNISMIPFEYIHAQKQYGGLGVLPLKGELNKYKIIVPGSIPKLRITDVPDQKVQGMSDDLMKFVSNKFDIEVIGRDVLLKNMREKNLVNTASANDKKEWYEKINDYYNNIKIVENKDINKELMLQTGIISREIYYLICDIFEYPETIKNYYNPIDVINSIIAKSEIKNYDIFNNIIMQVMNQHGLTKIQAMNFILKKYLADNTLVDLLSNAVQVCGMHLVMKILSDEIKYNSILEGYVRDTILTFIRNYVIHKLLTDKNLSIIIDQEENNLIEMMSRVELFIISDDEQGGIWRYLLP